MSNAYHFPTAFPWLGNVSDVEGNLSSQKVAGLLVQKIYSQQVEIYCLKGYMLYQFDIIQLEQFNFETDRAVRAVTITSRIEHCGSVTLIGTLTVLSEMKSRINAAKL